jgi:hypothetical protein
LRRADSNSNEDNKSYGQEVSKRNKVSIENWMRDHSCSILAKNLPTFCPETLCEAEFNSKVAD